MDLQMPIMDGFEASEKILQSQLGMKEENCCKIVALTAFHSSETIERCLNLGIIKVYNKPANINDIK